jgi:hypothetical protein
MINPQWGFNPIIIRMLFAVTLFQHLRGLRWRWMEVEMKPLEVKSKWKEKVGRDAL